jgi:cytochrome P450
MLTADERLSGLVADAAFVRDPYPIYRDFLSHPGWRSPSGYRVFAGYRDVIGILRDPASFGQEGIPYPNFHVLDPPDHTRLRKLVAKPFTQRAANRQESHITEIVDDLIDEVAGCGRMDLMTDFALRLPARVAASMLAVPIEDSDRWNRWLWDIGRFRGKTWYSHACGQEDQDAATAAATDSAEYFRGLIERRHLTRGSDIVSGLLDAREGDDRLTDEEILFSLVLLLGGSLHTTASQIGNTVRALFEHPRAMADVVADPGLVGRTVDEALRFDGALQAEYRVARRDSEVGGVPVGAGTAVIVVNAAANRDPSVFPDPDVFDIRRENSGMHLTFGSGIHRCLGAQLARMELVIALTLLTRRLRGLRPDGPPVQHGYDRWRGLSSFPVTWDGIA